MWETDCRAPVDQSQEQWKSIKIHETRAKFGQWVRS